MPVKDTVKDRVKDSVKDSLIEKELVMGEVKQAVLYHLSGKLDTEFIDITTENIVDIFYLNLYMHNQKRGQELNVKIKSTLNERQELLDRRNQLKEELKEFQSEIRDVNDGLICSLLSQEIKSHEEKINSFTVLGDEAEKLQVDLDEAVKLSVRIATRLIERGVVTLDQIRNNRYFFKKMGG